MKKADPFYKTTKWERLRKNALIKDKYMCQSCLMRKKRTQATCVHHIFPRDIYPSYQWMPWNLTSLCDKCHDELHNHFNGDLSERGRIFLKAKAVERGIKISMMNETILVIGLPGTGKSTYTKRNMDDASICYDLDAIAAAFRLSNPHEEDHKPARKMANDLFKGFTMKAHEYARRLFIIRTAPTIDQVMQMDPTKIVICKERFEARPMEDEQAARDRINQVESYAKGVNIPLEIIDRS